MLFRGLNKQLKTLEYSKVAPVFVLVSMFIWLTTALSEQHSAKIPLYLRYVDLDTHQYLESSQSQRIDVFCTGTGFRLMLARMFPNTISINSRAIQSKNGDFLLSSLSLVSYVDNHFDQTLKADLKKAVAINTPIQKAVGRLLPVRMLDAVKLEAGYDWVSDFSFTPDSLYVTGPEKLVNTLDCAYVSHDLTTPISSNFDQLCLLKTETQGLLQWSQSEVRTQRSVDRFTEHLVRVPIEIIQSGSKIEIQPIPRNAELNISVPLKDVKQLKVEDFRVVCEYQENINSSVLPLKVLQSPKQVRILKIHPEEVQFFIRK
jgi:hypothetical protein